MATALSTLGYCQPCEHVIRCQNWIRIDPMLTASDRFWSSSGTLWHVYRDNNNMVPVLLYTQHRGLPLIYLFTLNPHRSASYLPIQSDIVQHNLPGLRHLSHGCSILASTIHTAQLAHILSTQQQLLLSYKYNSTLCFQCVVPSDHPHVLLCALRKCVAASACRAAPISPAMPAVPRQSPRALSDAVSASLGRTQPTSGLSASIDERAIFAQYFDVTEPGGMCVKHAFFQCPFIMNKIWINRMFVYKGKYWFVRAIQNKYVQ